MLQILNNIFKFFNDLYWAIRHRTFDVHHVIKTGLRPSYYEIDTKILHASFNLLKDFVENETCYDCDLKGIKALKHNIERMKNEKEENNLNAINALIEALRLYDWWINIYPKYEDNNPFQLQWDKLYESYIRKDFSQSFTMTPDGVPKEILEERRKNTLEAMEYEERCMKETEDNLISLIKIMRYLYD